MNWLMKRKADSYKSNIQKWQNEWKEFIFCCFVWKQKKLSQKLFVVNQVSGFSSEMNSQI